MGELFTTKSAAKCLGLAEWQVRRIFELGDLPEPPKFGNKRMISFKLLPAIRKCCERRGWLEPQGVSVTV